MGYGDIKKTEHAGAKNGGGAWMTRAEAKEWSRHRRRADEHEILRRLRLEAETHPGGYC